MISSRTRDMENARSQPENYAPLLHQVLRNQHELRKIMEDNTPHVHDAQSTTTAGTDTSHSVIRIKASMLASQERRCPVGCRCACHVKKHYSSNQSMQHIVGLLFIGYSGRPQFVSRIRCGCQAQPVYRVNVVYLFPSWLLLRAIHIVLKTSAYGGIQVSLQSRNIVPINAKIFQLAVQTDIEGLQDLFVNGLASPNDSNMGGHSALQVSAVGSR